jgi:glycerol-3-phosphate acyltransferase PlsY
VGAIPTGYWLCQWLKGIDITQHGSGNIGATNVGRTVGKHYFILIFLCDAGKTLGVLAGGDWLYQGNHKSLLLFFMAAALLLGNAYSIFIHFKGGKGVATMVSILGYLYSLPLSMIFCGVWLVILYCSKRAFIATFAAYCLFVAMYFVSYTARSTMHDVFLLFLGGWLVVRHWRNIIAWLTVTRCCEKQG